MFLLFFAALTVIFLVHQLWYRRRNLPPGPFPLPFIGNFHSFWNMQRWEHKFLEWREKYGSVYTYWFGLNYIITVNDYKTAHELFVKDGDTFADRAATETLDYATRGGMYGIIQSSGGLWKDQRRFALRVLRDFGLGKNMMENRILDEVQYLYEKVDREINSGVEEIDFHHHTDIATGSVINSVVNGYRFTASGKEEEFYRLKEITEKTMKSFAKPTVNLASIYPLLAKLPPCKEPFEETVRLFNEIGSFLDGVIAEHIKTQDYSQEMEPRDFIDAYLAEMKRCEERGELGYFSKLQLRNIIMDLWIAGQETTSTTLTWAIAFLIRHPDAQKRMQEELDQVVGNDRLVTASDKTQLPYTNAVIMEVQRVANILPQNVPRRTTREVNISGYTIPKGAIILPQISVIMIDPNLYEKPREFNPSRFIDEKGQLKKADELIPFSIGKRQCLGEGLARMELFLFIANIFHRYEFLPGKEPPTLDKATLGFSMATQAYKCKVNRRY